MARVKLQEVCDVSWGDTTVTKASYVATGYPAFSASGCDGFLPYFDHDGPGIVLSAIGAQCGKTWFTRGKWSCIKNTIYIKSKSSKADTQYVFYALSNPDVWPKRGAAQPFISQTDARNVEIPFPPLALQRRIAGILSAYDELIENSQRRIKILGSMARALYREWFVHFRFPGHDAVPRVPSPLGEIPQGWEVKRLDQLAEIKGGKQLEKEDIHQVGEFPVFGGNGIQGYSEKATHRGFVIAFGRVGACCGSIHWSYGGAWLNNNSSSVAPLKHDELVLHHLLDFHFDNLRGGAAQPFISNSALAGIELVFPSEAIAERFCSIVRPLRLQQVTVNSQTQNLRRTRDLLLPRLLSGQIDVEAIA
ncbi:MAG: hypothetical protein FJW40_27085 [Acidobacteria bacterium]|nr:hypothetical protein [Acidobacteriota bacterium]